MIFIPKRLLLLLPTLFLVILPGAACSPQPTLMRGQSIQLSSFTDAKNGVAVSLQLAHSSGGGFLLKATFTPPAGYHLYSKDLPRYGANGQGRPTLLELTPNSLMKAAGPLAESIPSTMVDDEPDGPLVYPAGPVTLSLPVSLPPLSGWAEDQVSLTYMPCTETACRAPTEGKLVAIKIPGATTVSP